MISLRLVSKNLVAGLERNGFAVTSELEMRLINLARKLPERGKKAYQFLPENVKQDVLAIVDLIEKEPEISALYDKWKTHQTELNRIYKNDENFDFPKLLKNESFRPVLGAWAEMVNDNRVQVTVRTNLAAEWVDITFPGTNGTVTASAVASSTTQGNTIHGERTWIFYHTPVDGWDITPIRVFSGNNRGGGSDSRVIYQLR